MLHNYVPTPKPELDRIAILCEAPSSDEIRTGRLGTGSAMRLLYSIMRDRGISPANTYIGYLYPQVPPGGQLKNIDWHSPLAVDSRARVTAELEDFKPTVIAALGNGPLSFLLGGGMSRRRSFTHSVASYRGSILPLPESESPDGLRAVKVIGSYAPSQALRQYKLVPMLRMDLARVKQESTSTYLNYPVRSIDINPEFNHVIARLTQISEKQTPIALDIEGTVHNLTCLSIAVAADDVFIVPFKRHDGSAVFTTIQEMEVWRRLAAILRNPNIPKTLQNSLYDNFVLAYSYGLPIVNIADDTMLKHWELYCELEKSLGFQASLYTREPYYKSDRTVPSDDVHWRYCCKDSAVTFEINQVLDRQLRSSSREHYRFSRALLNPMLYAEIRGIRYDEEKVAQKVAELKAEQEDLQWKLDFLNGGPLNVKSPKQKVELLYGRLGLPTQRHLGSVTTNEKALLKLIKLSGHPVPILINRITRIRTRLQMLAIKADDDGRIRCGYNVVGTETGRFACYTSPTGSGYNLTTIPKKDRDLFVADPGCWMFQCDLSGADGWTVAAECAAHGDHTMLEDYRYGLKPAKLLVLAWEHGPDILAYDRATLAEMSKSVDGSDWRYLCAKRAQHGSNYLMGAPTMAETVMKDSGGSVTPTPADMKLVQQFYFRRYPGVKAWHTATGRQLRENPVFVSANGQVRRFFGRPTEALGQALANSPQQNTTYATSIALLRLWRDPENRRPDGSLVIEPLHQVHDAIVGQFPKDKTEWARQKLTSYLDNTILIAGQRIRIPFEGEYGRSWGELEHTI